jgi:hypothetical protein
MPDDTPSYPADAGAATCLLTVRGTTAVSTLDEARATHNSTAGAPQSAAGARGYQTRVRRRPTRSSVSTCGWMPIG